MKKILALAAVVGFITCGTAMAAEPKISIGLGVGMAPDYEGSEDYEAVPLPYAVVAWDDGDYVALNGNKLKWNLTGKDVEFGPLLQYRAKRDDVDNDQVDNMKKVDAATELGFFFAVPFGSWKATLEFAHDISDEHDGYLVTIIGDYNMKVSDDLKMTFGASTTYASDDYMETYFQVDDKNRGTSTLPDYKADDGEIKDVGVHISANYNITEKWSVLGIAAYKMLVGDAEDSPIVDDEGDDGQMFIGAMGIYHF
jgi:outer membrane protein